MGKSSKVNETERVVARLKKELEPLKKQEADARRRWSLGYNAFLRAENELQKRVQKGLTVDPVSNGVVNKTVQKLWETKTGWLEKSENLTKLRDEAREAIAKKEQEILHAEAELNRVLTAEKVQLEQTDSTIEKVFLMNDHVVESLQSMDKFLEQNVYPNLSEKSTQKMLISSDGLKKVVIMSNTSNDMDSHKVEQAKQRIEAFFERINPQQEAQSQDETTQMLTEILRDLLVVKFNVKPGPTLSRFLGLELDPEKFGELVEAQHLLGAAISYKRSNMYVRLFTRESTSDGWKPVRQSWDNRETLSKLILKGYPFRVAFCVRINNKKLRTNSPK